MVRIRIKFESFVNSERYTTYGINVKLFNMFESFVNSERYKTLSDSQDEREVFESFVNSERYKTDKEHETIILRLRALLIQKDTKHK